MEPLKGPLLSYILLALAVTLAQGQSSRETSVIITPTLTMMPSVSSSVAISVSADGLSPSSLSPQTTPSPTPMPTSSPIYPECDGDIEYELEAPSDALFEVVLLSNQSNLFNENEVDMFIMELAMSLDEYCVMNNTVACTSNTSMYNVSVNAFMENLTKIYSCVNGSIDDFNQLIIGLVYMYDSEIISTALVIEIIQNTTLMSSVRRSTQNQTVTATTTLGPTNSTSTTDMPSTPSSGLTDTQIIGIAVGIVVPVILIVIVVVIAIVVCVVISGKKSAKVATVSTKMVKRSAGDSPLLVSHGNTTKHKLAVSDL